MDGQFEHGVLPLQTHDEAGRESFLAAMRDFVATDLYAGNRTLYHHKLKPAFEASHGRAPGTRREVRHLMEGSAYYRMFGLLNRATQELLWDTVGESVERQLPALAARASRVGASGGTLRLDPALAAPAYAREVDIHVMPGGFHTELGPDDLFAGALYDRGVYIYAAGGLGPRNDGLGVATARFVRERFPDLRPARILELGCGAGMATLPLADSFPGAKLYGVDIAAPMLRYGHARAEAMGIAVHFSQADAGATDFPDEHFDLVVSNLLFHEVPQKQARRILHEAHRLLAPGGVTVHNDMVGWPTEPFEEFLAEWNGHNNNEPFERGSGTLDWEAACLAAGFPADGIFRQPVDAAYLAEQLAFVGYRGAVRR